MNLLETDESVEHDMEEGNDEEKEDPPLMFDQFGCFLFYLKKYYVLCHLFDNQELDSELKIDLATLTSEHIQKSLES